MSGQWFGFEHGAACIGPKMHARLPPHLRSDRVLPDDGQYFELSITKPSFERFNLSQTPKLLALLPSSNEIADEIERFRRTFRHSRRRDACCAHAVCQFGPLPSQQAILIAANRVWPVDSLPLPIATATSLQLCTSSASS